MSAFRMSSVLESSNVLGERSFRGADQAVAEDALDSGDSQSALSPDNSRRAGVCRAVAF